MSADRPSSNPFRRKENVAPTSASVALESPIASTASRPVPSTSYSLKDSASSKKVRIISPPIQTADAIDLDDAEAGSPGKRYNRLPRSSSTQVEAALEAPAVDPFVSEQSDDEASRIGSDEGVSGNSYSDVTYGEPEVYDLPQSNAGHGSQRYDAPARPSSTDSDKTISPRPAPRQRPQQSHGRASLDVDAFKRLLMTGDASKLNEDCPRSNPRPAPAPRDDSSTAASSISRQSMFDPTSEGQGETPRTSHEISPSDDEGQHLFSHGGKSSAEHKRSPPPVPRHGRHVELGKQDSTRPLPPISAIQRQSIRHQASPGILSPEDLNKPLPPPPAHQLGAAREGGLAEQSLPPRFSTDSSPTPSLVEDSEYDQAHHDPSVLGELGPEDLDGHDPSFPLSSSMPHAETSNLASCSSSSVSRTSSLLKKAPPVPPARRLSQKQRTRDEAPHLTRSMSSQSSAIPKPEERVWSLHARNSLPAPPPPPVRSSTIKKTPPPASPRRRPAQRIQPSTARPPPPPPPRRHRGSSGSRRDQPPSPLAVQEDPRSGEAGGTEEIDAINQDDDMSARAEPVSAEPSNTGGADILADISELQREVDALTERCKAGLNTEGL